MIPYTHLHVHSHYSILDGQASIQRLVDKAIADGMKGMALTDHGNMMGVKEFFNYSKKVTGAAKKELKAAQAKLDELRSGNYEPSAEETARLGAAGNVVDALIAEQEQLVEKKSLAANFKAIIGCEMYCARRKKELKEGKEDKSGWHLIVLAKNEKGYHNLIKLVSR